MTTLLIPGLHGSGDSHWQRWWLENDPSAILVAQRDWDKPRLHEWQDHVVEAVAAVPGAILVAHSLGCAVVAHLCRVERDIEIGGALLVAPADVDDFSWMSVDVAAFGPMPLRRLSFPSTVVASHSDPFVSFQRAHAFSRAWGARLVDLGHAGHINLASGFGPWPMGLELADELRQRSQRPGNQADRLCGSPSRAGRAASRALASF